MILVLTYFCFRRPNLSTSGYRIRCFLFFSKKSKVGSSEQEASLSVSKIQGHLVPYHVRKCVPTPVSGDVDIPKALGFLLLQHMSFQ